MPPEAQQTQPPAPEDLPPESQDPTLDQPDPGAVGPAFTEDDLREHFAPVNEDPDPDPEDQGQDPDPDPEPEPPASQEDPSDLPPAAQEPVDPPVPADPPASDPPPRDPTADPRTETIEINGVTYLLSDVQAQLEWARSLTPEQAARVAAALTEEPAPQLQTTPTPDPSAPTPPSDQFDPEQFTDPELAEWVRGELERRDAEIQRLRAAEEARAGVDQDRQREVVEEAWETTRQSIAEQYQLSDIEVTALTERMEQSGIVAFLAQRDGIADPEGLFRTAYEQTYWTTPEFRDRAIQQTVEQSSQQAAQQAAQEAAAATQAQQDRKTRAAALTGGGGTPAPRQPAAAPTDSKGRMDALAAGIAQALSSN